MQDRARPKNLFLKRVNGWTPTVISAIIGALLLYFVIPLSKLDSRVTALETKMEPMKCLPTDVATLNTKVDILMEHFDLSAPKEEAKDDTCEASTQ